MSIAELEVLAPFDGWCSALEEVPDAVFAGRMLGDGLAIDPTGSSVRAPCAGEIITLPGSAHAVSIRSDRGVDILVHVGIDTVAMAGRGFDALVRPGAQVVAGQELIRLDLDTLARGAKSLVTPIVITSPGVSIRWRHASGPITAGQRLFAVVGAAVGAGLSPGSTLRLDSAAAAAEPGVRHRMILPLLHGLHARPAARVVHSLKTLDGDFSIAANGRTADARSAASLLTLGARHGDEIEVRAHGESAGRAVANIIAAIEEARRTESAADHAPGPTRHHPRPTPIAPETGAEAVIDDVRDGVLRGVAAVRGFALGEATRILRREFAVPEYGGSSIEERAALTRALAVVRSDLQQGGTHGSAARRDILGAHVDFLDDPLINAAALEIIAAGRGAAFAWRAAIRRQVAGLEALADPRLRARADDLLDVEAQVLAALHGGVGTPAVVLPERAVLIADDLLPSQLTTLDPARLAAICLGRGGATSHVAILAAGLDIPMLIGLGDGLDGVTAGDTVIVDADDGTLHLHPDALLLERAHATIHSRARSSSAERTAAALDGVTADAVRIEIFANIGNVADAGAAVINGAEGCGLLRTEFLFIDRETAPDEGEQLAAYQAVADALQGRPLVLRLMDVGGDKPLRYLPMPHEDNPALGLRGVRTALARPDLLRTQLRAALLVKPAGVVQLLLPMISDVAEVRAVRRIIDELRSDLGGRPPLAVGVMIETPAAALTAAHLLGAADFLSIGSNDLTQYTLAMDRGHPELAQRADALHPGVLKLIATAATAGGVAGKTVAVCGGVAADRLAIPILLGLGVRELSVVPASVPAVKRQIRGLRLEECRNLAARCLTLESAAEVRAWMTRALANNEGIG